MRIALLVAVCMAMVLAAHSALLAQSFVSVWSDTGMDFGVAPAWFGNTGLVLTPSAFVSGPSKGTISYHWVDTDGDATDIANLNVGVAAGLEIGGTWIDGPSGDSELVGNAKWRLPVEKWFALEELPTVAIGGVDLTDELDRKLYVVLSKGMPIGMDESRRVNVHLGYGDSDGGILNGFFGGLTFGAFRNSVINAEYDGENFNADLRWGLRDRLTLDVGVLDGDFGIGLTYGAGK